MNENTSEKNSMNSLGKRGGVGTGAIFRIFSSFGLAIFLVFFVVLFSILLPNTFPTEFTFRSILSSQAVDALLALAVMIPLSSNNFDLSVGYFLGLSHILTIGLQVQFGLPWPLVALFVILVGVVVGIANGLLVTRAGIHPFIATLGTGTMIYGISNWYTGGKQIVGSSIHNGFYNIASTFLGIPTSAWFLIVVALILWVIYEYFPLGRYLYAIGDNARAAELTGISPKRFVVWTYIGSAVICAIAGVILASQLQVAQTSVGPDYLLPAFAGAFLGATSIRPGRVNVWGTIIAVYLLAVVVSGLEQLGAQFFVDPLFNGGVLIVAVGLSVYTSRRRAKIGAERRHGP